MKALLIFISSILFFVLVFSAGIIYSFNSGNIKMSLSSSGIYSSVSTYFKSQIIPQLSSMPQFGSEIASVKPELLNAYLQKKTEDFLDKTFDYLNGKTETLPEASFSDIQSGLVLSSKLTPLINAMPKTVEIPANVQQNIIKFRDIYSLVKSAIMILSGIVALFLILLFFAGKNWFVRARSYGKTFITSAVPGLMIGITGMVLLPMLANLQIQNVQKENDFFVKPALNFTASFLGKIDFVEVVSFATLFVLGIALIIIGKMEKRAEPKA
jgi:hypothetical protein